MKFLGFARVTGRLLLKCGRLGVYVHKFRFLKLCLEFHLGIVELHLWKLVHKFIKCLIKNAYSVNQLGGVLTAHAIKP